MKDENEKEEGTPRFILHNSSFILSPRISAALLITAAAFLILFNLGGVAFWDDEAHVALFARTLLTAHPDCAWDGRNLVPDHDAAGYDANLVNVCPQLDNYLAALSFKVFGDSPWAARLPFALCGIASILVFWRLLLLEFPSAPSLQIYALASASLSAPLLLYFRNCRYYALSVLLTLGILFFYRKLLRLRRPIYIVITGVLAGLLSLASILNCACLLGGLFARHLLFHRREFVLKDWLKISTALLIGALFAIPYVSNCLLPGMARYRVYSELMRFPVNPPLPLFWVQMLWRNFLGLNLVNAIPWSLGLVMIAFLLRKHPRESEAANVKGTAIEFLATLVGFIVVLSALSPQNIVTSSVADVRYLTPMLPVAAALMGVVFWWISQSSRLIAGTLLIAYLCSNLLGLTSLGNLASLQAKFRCLLPEYCLEIMRPYPTACSETSAYLRENSRQDETLWYWPDWMGKPLMYSVGDRIKLRGILDSKTLLPKETIAKLDPELFIENVFPNWVVSFARNEEVNSTVGGFSRTLPGTNSSYRYHLVKVLDVYWDQIQRPELLWHSFGPWRGYDKKTQSVFIFKRSEKPVAK